MKYLAILFLFALLHTLPLWKLEKNLVGQYGDPLAHAAIGEWYCKNVVTGNFQSDIYLSPHGVDFSGNYDSPFPYILTCPFVQSGPQFQFHLFTFFQVLLIVISSFCVAKLFFKSPLLQFTYVLFVWWGGYYVARSHQHMTLLSNIWGIQFVLYAIWSLRIQEWKSALKSSFLLALSFAGTFQNIPSLSLLALGLFLLSVFEERKKILSKVGFRNLLIASLVFSGVFLLLWGPMIVFTLKHGTPNVADQRQVYNLDLLSPLIPFGGNLLFQWIEVPLKLSFERYNSFDAFVFVVFLISLFAGSFWKSRLKVLLLILGVVYFFLSLGPELRINGEVVSSLSLNQWIYQYLPFSLTRTPARLALVTQLCIVLLAFLYLDRLRSPKTKKILSFVAVGWILVTGPLLSQTYFFPTFDYKSILPMKGLESLKNLPEDSVIVHIPSAWAQDPSQNFHRLIHGKKISAGYLAYPVYNESVAKTFAQDPFLGKLGCRNEVTAFMTSPMLENLDYLRVYLKKNGYRGFIVNKSILLGSSDCQELLSWTRRLLQSPWIKTTDESNLFLTAEIL